MAEARIVVLRPFILSHIYKALRECQVRSEDHPLKVKCNIYGVLSWVQVWVIACFYEFSNIRSTLDLKLIFIKIILIMMSKLHGDVSQHVTWTSNTTWKYRCSYNNYTSQKVIWCIEM